MITNTVIVYTCMDWRVEIPRKITFEISLVKHPRVNMVLHFLPEKISFIVLSFAESLTLAHFLV